MNQIVAFTGKARHGKDTAAKVLINEQGYVPESFTGPLKEICSIAFNFPVEYFNDPVLKEKPLDHFPFQSPREIAQTVGTEMFRKHYPGVWVENLKRRALNHEKTVITDLRFLDEAGAIKSLGGLIIRVIKLNADEEQVRQHVSETEQDQIIANGSIAVPAGAIDLLNQRVREMFPC